MSKRITKIPQLAKRRVDTHKGDFGKVLIVGGSRGMIGAPALAGMAALRSGAGLVRIAVPVSIQLSVAQLVPCATTIPLAEDEKGQLCRESIAEILAQFEDHDTVAIGCGIGLSNELQELISKVVTEYRGPLVVDADGLNNLAGCGGAVMEQLTGNTVLTPHLGEMRRLWGAVFRKDLPVDRIEQAEQLAKQCKCVVVLKGAGTVVTVGASTYVNETGNPGMATGGSGDVLTGVIGGLAGSGMDVLSASILGVYAHGAAGDRAAKKNSETGMIASDLINFLGKIWKNVSSDRL